MKDEPLLIVIVFLAVLLIGAAIFGGYRGTSRYAYDDSYRIPSETYRQPAEASYAYSSYTTYTIPGTSTIGGTCLERGGSSYVRSDNFGSYRVCYVSGLGECDEAMLVSQNVCVIAPYR